MNNCIICRGSYRKSNESVVSMPGNFICKTCGEKVLQERMKECEEDIKIQASLLTLSNQNLSALKLHNCKSCSSGFYHSIETKQERCPVCRLDNVMGLLKLNKGLKNK